MLEPELLGPERVRRLKRGEYDQLVEAGSFEDERVELLHGVLVSMSPNHPEHAGPIMRLTKLLVRAVGDRADVRVQLPYSASDESEPEPDIAVVPLGPWDHEHPARAHLVIEVAVSSVTKDRELKAPLYAASGVTEYWIVNVAEQCVEVFRDPDGTRFSNETRHGREASLTIVALSGVVVRVGDVIG
jgi:Uma2 family endonuclease